jgi:hypothetical protein
LVIEIHDDDRAAKPMKVLSQLSGDGAFADTALLIGQDKGFHASPQEAGSFRRGARKPEAGAFTKSHDG